MVENFTEVLGGNIMKLLVKRKYRGNKYTIGDLYINGTFFCNTMEDVDRGLLASMPLKRILAIKVKGKTCIPYGTYVVTIDIVSNKYSNYTKYPYAKEIGARMPRILNVPGFDGILIHPGRTEEDTDGCLIVGQNKIKGKVINSQVTWRNLYKLLEKASKRRELITITYE